MNPSFYLRKSCLLVTALLLSAAAWAQSVSNVTVSPTTPNCTPATISVSFNYSGFSSNSRSYKIEVMSGTTSVATLTSGILNFTSFPAANQTGNGSLTVNNLTIPTSVTGGSYTIKVSVNQGLFTTRSASSSAITVSTGVQAFQLTGGGVYCTGGAGLPIGLQGSQSGVSYQLKLNGTNTGTPVTGNGSTITFGIQSAAGTYTVVGTLGLCSATMTGSKTISISEAGSLTLTMNLAASYCASDANVTLTGTPSGGTFSGPGVANNVFKPSTLAPGSYTVVYAYTDPETSCTSTLSQQVQVVGLQFTQQPTLNTATVCANQTVTLNFTMNCPGNTVFKAELSDKNGAFGAPVNLGNVSAGTNNVLTIPYQTVTGTGYLIRVTSVGITSAVSATTTALAVNGLSLAAPTAQGPFCQNAPITLTVKLNANCAFPNDNVFKAQLSNYLGSFSTPVELGVVTVGSNTIPAELLQGLQVGTGYRIRILSTKPQSTSPSSLPFEIKGPTLTGTPTVGGSPFCPGGTATVSYTVPTGACGFSAGNEFRIQLSSSNGSFTTPIDLGVFTPGSVNSVVVPSGTPTGTGYRIRIASTSPVQVSSTSALLTVKSPSYSGTPTLGNVPTCPGGTVTLTFGEGCPFPATNTFTAQLSSASGTFSSPVSLGSVVPGANTLTIPANRPLGTSYKIRVVSSTSPVVTSASTASFRIQACTNRLSAELSDNPSLVVAPNPPAGNRIRCRVEGLANPQFSLYTAGGRSVNLTVQSGELADEYEIVPAQQLRAGVYILQATEGKTRLNKRVFIAE